MVGLYSTRQAEGLYLPLGFRPATPRTAYSPRGGCTAWSAGGGRRPTDTGSRHSRWGTCRSSTAWIAGPPGDRSPLISATLRLHPGQGLVARDSSELIKGYLVRSSWGDATCTGPFVASSPGVARLLLACALGARRIVRGGHRARSSRNPDARFAPGIRLQGSQDHLRMELGEGSGGRLSGLLEQYGTTPYPAT
jgi:hypothetical protein